MSEPFWLDYEKLLAIARTLRNHGDQIQSEICEILTGVDRLQELRSMPYSAYRESPEWQFKRTQKLEEHGYQCALCLANNEPNVHHRTYERRGCEQFSDLIVLCRDCHAKFHDKLKDQTPISKRRAAKL